jgi:hypothetical protein
MGLPRVEARVTPLCRPLATGRSGSPAWVRSDLEGQAVDFGLACRSGPIATLWSELDYASAESAQVALAGREGCGANAIGLWSDALPKYDVGAAEVATWAKAKGFDAVVWTALKPIGLDTSSLMPHKRHLGAGPPHVLFP